MTKSKGVWNSMEIGEPLSLILFSNSAPFWCYQPPLTAKVNFRTLTYSRHSTLYTTHWKFYTVHNVSYIVQHLFPKIPIKTNKLWTVLNVIKIERVAALVAHAFPGSAKHRMKIKLFNLRPWHICPSISLTPACLLELRLATHSQSISTAWQCKYAHKQAQLHVF